MAVSGNTILIAEADPGAMGSIHSVLRGETIDSVDAFTGDEAITVVREREPQLLVLDAFVQQPTGLDVCRELRSAGHQLPIIMVSTSPEPVDCVVSLEVGADDFVRKPLQVRELMARIRAQLRRCGPEMRPHEEQILEFDGLKIDVPRHQVFRDGQEILLTVTEFNLLALLASGNGKVMSRTELLSRVWGYEPDSIETRTVDAHVYRLRHKLEPNPADPRFIHSVSGIGYRFAGC
jgi:two-component system response regulator MtrA